MFDARFHCCLDHPVCFTCRNLCLMSRKTNFAKTPEFDVVVSQVREGGKQTRELTETLVKIMRAEVYPILCIFLVIFSISCVVLCLFLSLRVFFRP